ncbi:uncharacterized protein LOC113866144 [Abrus precatorius]|uniref:Uncharacterized protein LOC113866144 n=1 Tax=Abrus precatorius TaxID=3816 RepID=A0A8B8LPN7_ABRPR|nr:uncharacterized protein LOC113866144 [Abrus precatorius]
MLMKQLEMTDLGPLSYFLGIEFKEIEARIFMHQGKYVEDLLKKFNMFEFNMAVTPAKTRLVMSLKSEGEHVDATLYKQIVGSLRYLCNTRPNLAFSVGLTSRYMEAPKTPHMMVAKRILRYIRGTMNYGLWLGKLLKELKIQEANPMNLFVDNNSIINLAKHPVNHGNSKHIETRYHCI